MKILSVCQPFAWAIIHGPKRIENRTWRTSYRGPLLIHASKTLTYLERERPEEWPGLYGIMFPPADEIVFGAVIGIADLVDCRAYDMATWPVDDFAISDPFAEGPYCWCLRNVRPLPEPVPCRGKMYLQDPDAETMMKIHEMFGPYLGAAS